MAVRAVRVIRQVKGPWRGATCALAVVTVAIGALGAAGPAVARTPSAAAVRAGTAHAVLTLSVRDGAGPSAPVIAATELTCRPDGGSHPGAAAACRALADVHGHLDRLPGDPGICPMIYRQATAVAYGHWGARTVHFTKTFSNTCRLHQALTPVYDF